MRLRIALAVLLAVAAVASAPAGADEVERYQLARQLVMVVFDSDVRTQFQAELADLLMRTIARQLQAQLNRRLLGMEVEAIDRIATRFVKDALPQSQMEQIYAKVYASYFDESELRELTRFYASSAGKKSIGLRGQIGLDALQQMARVVEQSPARAQLIADLQKEFPVLRPGESP